jgi:uroporphyrinogen-III decarboxylase
VIGDMPCGKAVYWFERTDIYRAKEVLGDTVCIRGNVSPSLMTTGSPEEVDASCRQLIEKVGRDGGFILDTAFGIPDEAPVENVRAMYHSVRKYSA